jgi:hypothetical protein
VTTVGAGQAKLERLKVVETEALLLLVTVTVTEATVPRGIHTGAVQTTWLVLPVLEGTPKAPAVTVHVKRSWGDSSSRAVTLKVTAAPASPPEADCEL